VGLPVYNGERFLSAALDSLLAQTFEDFELIISDNASTDATPDICRAYAAMDDRVRYVSNERNIGVYRNCNQVFRLSRGEYFKLAAADDLCHPELLASCVEVLDHDRTVVAAYAQATFVDEDGQRLPIDDPGWHLMTDSRRDRLLFVISSGHWVNVFFGLTRSTDLAQTRLFPLYAGGDCGLLGELSLKGRFYEVPKRLFFRRVHCHASSQNIDLAWQSQFFKGRAGRVELPFWHVCLDHCRTILGSDLSTRDKVSCLKCILARMVAGRRELFGELYAALRFLSAEALTIVK
jgi:glycosyltransferase involved in cell wall biosynthesis